MKFKLPCGNREYYLQRTPECLVVEGYRRWVAGYETGSIEPWEIAWSYYSRELGAVEGRRALADLSCFVRELRTCATCRCACTRAGPSAFAATNVLPPPSSPRASTATSSPAQPA